MSHKTVACTVTLRASFQRKRQFGRTVDLSLPGRTTEAVWKELRLALRTGRFYLPQVWERCWLRGPHSHSHWVHVGAEDSKGYRQSCLSVRDDASKDTHIAHCMEILIAEDSETRSESRPGPGKPPPQSFSRVQPKHWKQTRGPVAQSASKDFCSDQACCWALDVIVSLSALLRVLKASLLQSRATTE